MCRALGVAVPRPRRAQRDAPQQFNPGETVELHSLGVKLTLPSSTGWTVAVAVDGTASWDVLRPLSGATPGLQIQRSPGANGSDCNDVAASLSKDQGPVRKPTTLAPATWDPWVYEVEGRLRLCTNTIEGPVLADVSADVSSIAAADVIPVLDEVSRVLGGRRSSSPLVTKGPVVSQVGTITLAYAGVRVVVPSGWSVKTFEREGRKIDLLERFEPKDPPLYFTVRRALGKCGPERRPDDVVVERPEYLPQGFLPRVLERTKGEGAHESVLCVELGPEAVVVEIGWTRRGDLLDVRTMLAHVSEIAGRCWHVLLCPRRPTRVLEPVDRVRATLSADAHVLTTYGRERAFGGGASLDLWTVTNASNVRSGSAPSSSVAPASARMGSRVGTRAWDSGRASPSDRWCSSRSSRSAATPSPASGR